MIRPALITLTSILMFSGSAHAECTTVAQCAQEAVEAAQAAGARVQELERRLVAFERSLPSRFKCKTAFKDSPFGRNQSVVVDIPANDRDGAFVTVSKPTPSGWHCIANDPPNIPLPLQVRAHVIYCQIK